MSAATEVIRKPLFAHWCRQEHQLIAHNDSEHERCPMCRLMSERDALRDKLLEVAKACEECGGTGCVDVLHRGLNNRLHSVSEDCPECLDIRALLQ